MGTSSKQVRIAVVAEVGIEHATVIEEHLFGQSALAALHDATEGPVLRGMGLIARPMSWPS